MQTASSRIFCVILHKNADQLVFPFRFTTCIEPVKDVTLLSSSELSAVCAALLQPKAKLPLISSHVWPLLPFSWIIYTHNGSPSMISWVSEYNMQRNPCRGLAGTWGCQEAEPAIFQDNRHMNMVGFKALHTGRFYPQDICVVVIFVRGWVDLRTIVRSEDLCQSKIPIIPSRIELATSLLLAQFLDQLRHCPLSKYVKA